MKKAIEQKNLNKLIRLLAAMDENLLTRQEFVNQFKRVLKVFQKLKTQLETNLSQKVDTDTKTEKEQLKKLQQEFSQVIAKAQKDSDSTFSGLKKRTFEMVASLFAKSQVEEKVDEINKKIQEADSKLLQLRDGKDADEEKVTIEASKLALKAIKEDIVFVRDALENLKGKERLRASAISNLVRIHIGKNPPKDKKKLWVDVG